MSLVILLTYCSNERMFIDTLLLAALNVASRVVVAVGRRLFDGRDEDVAHISDLIARYPRVTFVWFDVPDELLGTPIVLHNNARIAARDQVPFSLYADSWVLLLDGDEVPRDEGRPLLAWWNTGRSRLDRQKAYKLANRWFFLHPRLASERTEDSVVLVHCSHLSDKAMSHVRERDGICMTVCMNGGTCLRGVSGNDGMPMFDHFSWVRETREKLIAKVTNWGHTGERDWVGLINHAMDELEQGRLPDRDFVHGLKLHLLEASDDSCRGTSRSERV